jgi:hypothetical protein
MPNGLCMLEFEGDPEKAKKIGLDPRYPCEQFWAFYNATFVDGYMAPVPMVPYRVRFDQYHKYISHS